MNELFEFQLFPHSTIPLHDQDYLSRPFLFLPVEKVIGKGTRIQIGRKTDKSKFNRGASREDRATHNVSVNISHFTPNDKTIPTNCITFKSKVVSRYHAEFWLGDDNLLYFKDVGSSSGSFLNQDRLSLSGLESKPFVVNSGDIIQLGVDYQGRHEEIYKAVVFSVYINMNNNRNNKNYNFNKQNLNRSLRSLLSAMNPMNDIEEEANVDCCICLAAMSPFQSLFLAPCSHCFHYKCVSTLLGAGFMFQCPLCRQVANLYATVNDPEVTDTEDDYDIEIEVMESNEDEPIASSAMDIPGSGRREANVLNSLISPSTPLNTSNMPSMIERISVVPRQELPTQIFNTLNRVATTLSLGIDPDMAIHDYGEQMRAFLQNVAVDGTDSREVLLKIIKSLHPPL